MNPPTERVLTTDDRIWAERAASLDVSSLEDLRAVAEKWRGGLTAITGAIAVVTAVGAPYVTGSLVTGDAKTAVGLLMAAAIVLLTVGTWAAMTAAFGVPSAIDNSGEALRTWSANAAKDALTLLTVAKYSVLAGFVTLATAALVGFFGAHAPDDTVLLVTKGGDSYCGVLSTEEEGATLVVTGSDGTRHAVMFSQVESAILSADCR